MPTKISTETSKQLVSARDHLSRAEATYRSKEGFSHLEQGLALLEEVMASEVSADRTIARNLASTYSARIIGYIKTLVENDRALPEPELEHLFKVIVAFDEIDIDLPPEARSTKVGIARRLIERYYEGHPPTEKQKALDELMKISHGKRRTRRKGKAP